MLTCTIMYIITGIVLTLKVNKMENLEYILNDMANKIDEMFEKPFDDFELSLLQRNCLMMDSLYLDKLMDKRKERK